MMRTKRTALTFILSTLCVAALALAAEPLREEVDQTFNIVADGRVSLENVNGSVLVNVWDRNTVRVQAVKEADTSEDLERLRVEINSTPSGVQIITRMPERNELFGRHRHQHLSVEYTLTVPRGATLDRIELVNGNLTVSGLGGQIRAELVNGDVKATALTGSAEIETVNGTVELELDRVDRGQYLALESVNGAIELRLPASASADVRAETVSGSISNDFGIEVIKHEYVGREMAGTIGGGGADVRMENVNGRIRLLKK